MRTTGKIKSLIKIREEAKGLMETKQTDSLLMETKEKGKYLIKVREGDKPLMKIKETDNSLMKVREQGGCLIEIREEKKRLMEIREGGYATNPANYRPPSKLPPYPIGFFENLDFRQAACIPAYLFLRINGINYLHLFQLTTKTRFRLFKRGRQATIHS